MTVPTLTVIIPTRNRPALVLRAIASVKAQMSDHFRAIVVDDGSDVPLKLVDQIVSDDRFQVIRRSDTPSPGGARNAGVRNSGSDYLAFLDDDDELSPQFVQTVLSTLTRTPEIDFLWCSAGFVDDDDDERKMRFRRFSAQSPGSASLVTAAISIGTGFGLTVRRTALETVGFFDESLRVTEDTDCLIKLLKAGFCPAVIPELLVTVHDHSGERLTSASANHLRIAEIECLFERHGDFLADQPEAKSILINHLRDLSGNSFEGPHYAPRRSRDVARSLAFIRPIADYG